MTELLKEYMTKMKEDKDTVTNKKEDIESEF